MDQNNSTNDTAQQPTLLEDLEAQAQANDQAAAEQFVAHDKRRKEERTAYKQKRRFDAAKFVPSVSHPVDYRDVVLQTPLSQKLFTAMFPRAQLSSYGIGQMLQIIGRDDNNDEVEGIVKTLIDKHAKDIQREIDRLEKLKSDNAIAMKIRYTDPKAFEIGIFAPPAARVLHLMQDSDRLNVLADELWHGQFFSGTQRKTIQNDWKRKIAKLVRELHNIYVRSKAAASRNASARDKAEDVKRAAKVARLRAPKAPAAAALAPVGDVFVDDGHEAQAA